MSLPGFTTIFHLSTCPCHVPRNVLAMESLPTHSAKAVATATTMPIRVARSAVQRARFGFCCAKSAETRTWEESRKPYNKYLSNN